MKEYPLLIPPETISHAKGKDQTKKEAREYFDWLMSVRDERVCSLLSFLEEDVIQEPHTDLLRIGEKFQKIVRQAEFSHYQSNDGQLGLTNQGYALAADMGLLIAELIQRYRPHVGWTIEKRKIITYNTPVLTGFPVMNPDPIRSSIARAFSVLDGTYQADAWWSLFDKWMEHTAKTIPTEDASSKAR